MIRMRRAPICLGFALFVCACAPLPAVDGQLRLFVRNLKGKPLKDVVLKPKGSPEACEKTDEGGFTFAKFTYDHERPYKLSMMVREPQNFFILSPVGGGVPVPTCNGTECFETVVLAKPGERIEDPGAVAAIVVRASRPQLLAYTGSSQRDAAVAEIAKGFGISSADLEQQLHHWAAADHSNPSDRAVAALYVGAWDKAELESEALLAASEGDSQGRAHAYTYLASALYETGRYRDSAENNKKAVALHPASSDILNFWGVSLAKSGALSDAELVFRANDTDSSAFNHAVLTLNRHPILAAASLTDLANSRSVSPSVAETAATLLRTMPNTTRSLLLAPYVFWILFGAGVLLLAFTGAGLLRDYLNQSLALALGLVRSWFLDRGLEMANDWVQQSAPLLRRLSGLPVSKLDEQGWYDLASELGKLTRRRWLYAMEGGPADEARPQLIDLVSLLEDVDSARRRRRRLILLAEFSCLLLIASVGAISWYTHQRYADRPSVPLTEFSFNGRITDPSGQPLAGARVYAIGSDLKVFSDTDGHFRYRYNRSEGIIGAELEGYLPDVATGKAGQGDLRLVLRKRM